MSERYARHLQAGDKFKGPTGSTHVVESVKVTTSVSVQTHVVGGADDVSISYPLAEKVEVLS